jgi:hypothetical protein
VEVIVAKSKSDADERAAEAGRSADEPRPQSEAQPQPPADASGDTVHVEGGAPSRGAQVILTGEAQTAARGGLAGDLEGNTLAKRALEADGTVADGSTPDGSTSTGKPPADVVVTEQAQPGGSQPAEPGTTRVDSTNPQTNQ